MLHWLYIVPYCDLRIRDIWSHLTVAFLTGEVVCSQFPIDVWFFTFLDIMLFAQWEKNFFSIKESCSTEQNSVSKGSAFKSTCAWYIISVCEVQQRRRWLWSVGWVVCVTACLVNRWSYPTPKRDLPTDYMHNRRNLIIKPTYHYVLVISQHFVVY
jgi:hypothetical protein